MRRHVLATLHWEADVCNGQENVIGNKYQKVVSVNHTHHREIIKSYKYDIIQFKFKREETYVSRIPCIRTYLCDQIHNLWLGFNQIFWVPPMQFDEGLTIYFPQCIVAVCLEAMLSGSLSGRRLVDFGALRMKWGRWVVIGVRLN